ncbi:peptidoglycan bridge formation glycyltransferase FemA/FemB family protein, partial [bacterium]|nr:peptidoglycan bridge formation glycyltransferase FemA/FemB family protein [bacterium]
MDLPINLTTAVDAPGPEWDDFLLRTPGGHHIQSALWAEVKSSSGWKPLRVVVRENGRIVAGIQVLLRSVGLWTIGYAGGGPVFGTEDAAVRKALLEGITRGARQRRTLYLVLQPAREDAEFTSQITARGFRPSSAELISKATILLDLSRREEELLAGLRKRHRSRIRHSQREGVRVIECGEADLGSAYSLMKARAERRGYSADSLETFRSMWRALHPRDLLRVTLGEAGGEISSALVMLCWGDTVFWKRGGWNGKHGHLGLNEFQHWESILWARQKGYRYVDMEGIDFECAREILFGEKASYDISKSPNFFKLGFGGELTLNPAAREFVFNPAVRYAYQ